MLKPQMHDTNMTWLDIGTIGDTKISFRVEYFAGHHALLMYQFSFHKWFLDDQSEQSMIQSFKEISYRSPENMHNKEK